MVLFGAFQEKGSDLLSKKETIDFLKMKYPDDMKHSLTCIVDQLEKYGRAITPNGKASRLFSQLVKQYKDDEMIYFGKHRQTDKSIIALSTSAKIIKIDNNKIKFKIKIGD